MFEITENKMVPRSANLPQRSRNSRSRIYVFTQGESVLSNVLNRYNRPTRLLKDLVLNQYPQLEGCIRWSQTAGCSCGCSPAFIVNGVLRDDNGQPVDIFITAKFS